MSSAQKNGRGGQFCFADFFAGPGGLSLGFELTDSFTPVYAVDADKHAAKTYKENRKNLGVEVLTGPVSSVSARDVLDKVKQAGFKRLGAVLAGPPCRPYSMANRSRENRWTQAEIPEEFRDLIDLISELAPLSVVIENVPTLANIGGGKLLELIEEKLSKDYRVKSGPLRATDFGVAQFRRRLFMIGVRKEFPLTGALFPAPAKTKPKKVRDAIGDLPPIKGAGLEVTQYGPKKVPELARMLRNGSQQLFDHQVHRPYEEEVNRFRYIDQGSSLRKAWEAGELPRMLVLNTYYADSLKKMHFNIYHRLAWRKPSCTITHVRKAVLIHPDKRQGRLLSVREAARLQSFLDSYRFYAGTLSGKYQQVADAVPTFMSRGVAQKLEEVLPKSAVQLAVSY